jgi:radical SAM protein with 4Fe4S-binding SPASM domain
MGEELPADEIVRIADEAVSLGAIWCLLSGGEPLLRKDFFDIYLALKRKGLLVSVFTNATLITPEHIRFFRKYPPRDIEITVYGASQEIYERVTRKSGSFNAFRRGLELFAESGIPVTLKAMALRSNYDEMPDIVRFCSENNAASFRFDPFLHLRYDGNPARNREIISERLSPDEVVALEGSYLPRFEALKKNCDELIRHKSIGVISNRLFRCGVGGGNFCVSYDGIFRFCSSLWHPDCVSDLSKESVAEAWNTLFGIVTTMESVRPEFSEKCRVCSIKNLCMWCPAHAYLETGRLDSWVDSFCRLAHAREKSLEK